MATVAATVGVRVATAAMAGEASVVVALAAAARVAVEVAVDAWVGAAVVVNAVARVAKATVAALEALRAG